MPVTRSRGNARDALPAALLCLVGTFAALLILPRAAVELADKGLPAQWVGGFAALPALVMLITIPTLPMLHRSIGRKATLTLGFLFGLSGAVFFMAEGSFAAWSAGALLLGGQFALVWPTADTIIAERVDKARAGRLIGLYQSLLGAVIALGPATSIALHESFGQSAALSALLCGLALASTLIVCPTMPATGTSVPRFERLDAQLIALAPLLCIATIAGAFETGLGSSVSLYALHVGLGASVAVLMISAIAVGSLAAQFPLGWLADRFSDRRVLTVIGWALAVSALLLLATLADPSLLWCVAVVWGALGGGLQTLLYLQISRDPPRHGMALSIATVTFGYTLGNVVGPSLGGMALGLTPNYGLAGLALIFVAVLSLAVRQRPTGP